PVAVASIPVVARFTLVLDAIATTRSEFAFGSTSVVGARVFSVAQVTFFSETAIEDTIPATFRELALRTAGALIAVGRVALDVHTIVARFHPFGLGYSVAAPWPQSTRRGAETVASAVAGAVITLFIAGNDAVAANGLTTR